MIRRSLRFCARALNFLARESPRVVRLEPTGRSRGAVVLSYLTDAFDTDTTRHYHTNRWECATMAHNFTQAGYRVEVIENTDTRYRPPPDCVALVDLHSNLERLATLAPTGAR